LKVFKEKVVQIALGKLSGQVSKPAKRLTNWIAIPIIAGAAEGAPDVGLVKMVLALFNVAEEGAQIGRREVTVYQGHDREEEGRLGQFP
jgi:hypothetical protein